MAQHDYVIANGTGAAVRSDLNNGLSAIVTQNSGATEPATTYAFMRWADTTAGVMKMRNSANNAWITLYQLDGEWTNIAFENGTAAAPSIYFKDSGTDTGFYSPGANQVGISTGGTARLTIDSNGNVDIDSNTLYVDATNNRVGLGVSDPGQKLVIGGGTNGRTRIKVDSGSGNFGKFEFSTDSALTTSAVQVAEITANITGTGPLTSSLQFATNSGNSLNTAMTIDSSQRVGIGSTVPGYPLTVVSDGASQVIRVCGRSSDNNSNIAFSSNNQGTDYAFLSSGPTFLAAAVNGSERCRLTSDGKFLAGTSSSSASVGAIFQGNSGGTAGIVTISKTSNNPPNGDELGFLAFADNGHVRAAQIVAARDGGTWTSGSSQPTRLTFSTTADGASSPTERMRISSAGNTMIGCTTANNNNSNSFAFNVENGNAYFNHLNGTASGTGYVQFALNGTVIGTITQNGTTAVAYNTTSDYRLKENVVSLTGAAHRINQLQVRRFNFIAEPDRTVDGFIAHEVQAVVPEAITGEKDAVNEDGSIKPQGIDQSKLVPLLTAALQEALVEIESLKARVTALEP